MLMLERKFTLSLTMITCSNCHHINPDGAIQCEACYAPLPAMINCPHCGIQLQADARFCGQCGNDLVPVGEESATTIPTTLSGSSPTAGEAEAPPAPLPVTNPETQLPPQVASLLHVQTQKTIELPVGREIIHLGKPNDRLPPDIDISGFPNSQIVSRVHAQIRVEGDGFFLEDLASANGTYVNHEPLLPGSRYRLSSGDRMALGKEDKVSFIFQISEEN